MAACAHHAAGPVAPPAVRAELAQAERAELARDHFGARRHYDAAVAAAEASGHLPSIRLARRELADTLLSWGELAQAEEQLARLARQAPGDAATWHDLGIVRHARGDVPGAIAALVRARGAAPADPRPRIALAALYWKAGRLRQARGEYEELLRLDLSGRLRDKVRWALEQLARPDRATPAGPPAPSAAPAPTAPTAPAPTAPTATTPPPAPPGPR